MHNMIIRCLSVEITYVTDCSLGVRLYHDINAVIIGILSYHMLAAAGAAYYAPPPLNTLLRSAAA